MKESEGTCLLFIGFELPRTNYSKLPHQLIEALPIFSSLAELKCVLYVLRHTWGYQEFADFKRITLDEFANGRKRKDGSRMDKGVGMSENAVLDGLGRAIEHGFLVTATDERSRPGRPAHTYQLKEYSSEVEEKEANKPQELRIQSSEVEDSSEKDTQKDTIIKKDTVTQFPSSLTTYRPNKGKIVSCVDPDTGEEIGEEGWERPDSQIMAQALVATGLEYFEKKSQFTKLRRIEALLDKGKISVAFWENRLACTIEHSWTLDNLLQYTLSPTSQRKWQRKNS